MTPFKIVFCGLDNSGKTSILLVLENKFSLLTGIAPTKGSERQEFDVLGYPIIKWDLGGQQQYRENYIENNYFDLTDLIFYTIDMQDPDRFEDSIDFLDKIIEYFKKTNQSVPKIVICLHKVDPDLVDNPQIQLNIKKCKSLLEQTIKADYLFFQTSIYDNWSVRKAFSKGLLKLSSKSRLLDNIMSDFLEITQSSTLLLLDEDALIFSEVSNDQESYQLLNIITPRLATMADKLVKYGKEIDVFEGKIGGWVYFKPLNIKDKTFYIVVFNKNIHSFEEINFALPDFTDKITNTLQTFFI
ncbi:MAG: ADP-ribosylation factor-like protein [Candidatus Helarchaeota archaeon]